MSGTERSSEGLDIRRRKLLFRSWHRGLRELDLIMGTFADSSIESLSDHELEDLETLLNVNDTDLLKWFTEEEQVPEAYNTQLFRRILAFRREMPF